MYQYVYIYVYVCCMKICRNYILKLILNDVCLAPTLSHKNNATKKKRHFAPRPMRSSKVALDHPIGSISAQNTVASRASASSMVNPGQAGNIWQCMSVLCNGEGNISLYKISLDWSRNILLHLTALAALASSPFGCFLKMDENGRPQTSPNSPPWCGLGPIR